MATVAARSKPATQGKTRAFPTGPELSPHPSGPATFKPVQFAAQCPDAANDGPRDLLSVVTQAVAAQEEAEAEGIGSLRAGAGRERRRFVFSRGSSSAEEKSEKSARAERQSTWCNMARASTMMRFSLRDPLSTAHSELDGCGDAEDTRGPRMRWRRKKMLAVQRVIPRNDEDGASIVAKLTANLGDTVTAVSFAEDDTMFAAGANNRRVMLFSTDTGQEVAALTAKAGVTSIVFLGSGEKTRVAAGTFSGAVTIWHVGSGEQEHELTFGSGESVLAMAAAAAGRRFAVGGKAAHVSIYRVAENVRAADPHCHSLSLCSTRGAHAPPCPSSHPLGLSAPDQLGQTAAQIYAWLCAAPPATVSPLSPARPPLRSRRSACRRST